MTRSPMKAMWVLLVVCVAACGGKGAPHQPPDIVKLDASRQDHRPDAAEVYTSDGTWTVCPPEVPEYGTPCEGSLYCVYATDICCGKPFDNYYCECGSGTFDCVHDDPCLGGGWCGGPDVGDTVDEVSSDAPDAPTCGVEGEVFGEPAGSLVCCEGLVAVWHGEPDQFGNCGADFFPAAICTACGDQVCGSAENFCNCPMDCPPPECIPEGETGPVTPNTPPCCDGLPPTGIAEVDPLTGECIPLDGAFLCTDCNDGICSPWENTCICPEDCPEAGEECFGLGEQFNALDTNQTCCEGLVASPDNVEEFGACLSPNCPCMICLTCGDQSCDAFETHCNCAQDCEPETPCAKAGELVPVWLPNYNCCDGLTKVANEEYDQGTGQCTPLVGASLCTECPSGICEFWETPCTCPEDC